MLFKVTRDLVLDIGLDLALTGSDDAVNRI